MSWEGYDNSQVPYAGRRHYQNDQHEDFSFENRDNYPQENRGEYPLESGFEYQVENREDNTSTLAQDVVYIQEQDVNYTEEDLRNELDQRTNVIFNSRNVFTHQRVRNERGHQFYRVSSYRGRNKHLTNNVSVNRMRHLSEQENRSPSISPRSRDSSWRQSSYRKYSRNTRSPGSSSPRCSNERLSTSPSSPHCATERLGKSHRSRDSSEKYSHRRHRSRSYDRYRSRSKGRSRSRSPRRESRKRSCERSGRSYSGSRPFSPSRDNKDSYRSDYSPGRSDKNRCKSTELKVSGGSYKYSPDKDYKYSNTSRHKKSASSSSKDRKKKKTSWKKEEEDMTENLPSNSDKSKIKNCNDIENVVSNGIKAIRYGLVPEANKEQQKVTRTKRAMRHKHQNNVLSEYDLECLHTKNDRYHYYRNPNNSTDKSSSNKSSETNNSKGDKSMEKTSKETSVFDNSYINIKAKSSSNAIKLARSISDVCKTRITADGKRSFSDIKEGEQVLNDVKKLKLSSETSEDQLVSNDVKKLKLSSETSEDKLVSNDVKKLKLSSETSEDKLVSNDVKKLKLSSETSEDQLVSNDVKKLKLLSETSEDKLVSNDVKKLKLSSETSEDIVANVNMSGDKISLQSGCESVFTSSHVHTEEQDQSLNDNLIHGECQKNRAHSVQSNTDMSNDNIQPVCHTKHIDAGVNKLQTHVATISTGARPRIETTHKSLQLDTQTEVVPYFTNISKESKLLNKLNTRKALLPTPKLGYMNTAAHVTHNSKPTSSWNRFQNRKHLLPSPRALHVDVVRNTCQFNEQSTKLPQDLPIKEQLDSAINWFIKNNSIGWNLSKGSVESEENTSTSTTSLETGQTEKTNVEENMMAIRQEQSKYQEKQGYRESTNDVNVALKTGGSYNNVQNTRKDVVKKTEMKVNNSDDQERKKSDQNKFRNVRTSDQKEVKVRKSDQKEMKVKCLYEKEGTHEKKLIKSASFNSLDNTEVLNIKHKQEKKRHSSGQVIKLESMQSANRKPSDGDNNNNVHDMGRRKSSEAREHVKKNENRKQKLPTDSTIDITKDYQCSGASGIAQNTVHSDKKLDTMRKSNMATSVGEKEPSTRSDSNSKSVNRSIYRGKKEHSSKSTEHSSKSTEHSSKSTEHSSKSTEHSSKPTEHSSKSTEHSSKSTKHSFKSTEHSSKSTEHSSKSTEHSPKSTVTDLQSLVKDDMTLSLESCKDQSTNIKELSMSPKNQNIESKMTSTPVSRGRTASGHRDLLLSPVERNESIDKCRHGTGSERGKDKANCTVTSNTISDSDCSTDNFMVIDSWQETSPSKINDEKSQNETKPQPSDKEQEQTTSQINTDIDKTNTVGDKFVMKKKSKSVKSSPLQFTTIKKMKCDKKKMKALAKTAAKIFKENMMSNRRKGNKDELENKESHKMSIDTESHDKSKVSQNMDKKAESHNKSNVSQNIDKKVESHDKSNVSQNMDKKAELHDKSKVSQNMDKKAESHDKSNVSQNIDKKAEPHDKSNVSQNMDKKAELHDKSKVSQNMDKKVESHDKSNVSQSMDKKAEPHDKSKVSQNMDKKAESHDKSNVSQSMDKKAESHDKSNVSQSMDKKTESHDKSNISQSMDKKTGSHDKSNVSQSMDKKAESHDKSNVSQSMDKKAESHDKSNVSQCMDKKADSHDKSNVSQSMDKKDESHDKSNVSQSIDKKDESHDKSNVSQLPFPSLFGRKIRTCLEDFPLIKTPKKNKSSDDEEDIASVSNPALSLPVNVEQTLKEKLKPKKNVVNRLINVKLDKKIKFGSLTNEEKEIKTNKYSEHDTETGNNITSSKKQFVANEEMKHVETQDSETKKIYQQEIKLTDRSKEKSHNRNILCQTKQETKHLKCEKNNNKKEVDDLKKRDNKGNHANKKEHERNVKKEEKSHKRFKTDKEQCTMVESKTKQSTMKHKEHKTDCLEKESEIQKDKVEPKIKQSTLKHKEHKTDCLEKESEIQKDKVEPKTKQPTMKHKEHKTDCLEKESEIQKDKVEPKTKQPTMKHKEHKTDCLEKESEIQKDKVEPKTKQPTMKHKEHKTDCLEKESEIQKDKVEPKTKQSTLKHKEHKTDCLEKESEIQKDKVEPKTKQPTMKHKEHKTDCLEKESEIKKDKVEPNTKQSTLKHKEHKTDCLEKESEIQKDKVELKTKQSKGKLQECSQKETYLQNEKGLKTLEINYRSKHEIDQMEAKIQNDEIVLKNQEKNRLEPDDSQIEKDSQIDFLNDENNDLSIIDSIHENEDVDVYTDNDIQSTHTTDEYDDSFECVGIIENVDLCTIDTLSADEKEKLYNVKDVEINQNTSISTEYDIYSGEEIDENELLVDFGPDISQEVEIQTSFEEVCLSVVEEIEISTSNEVLPCHTVRLEIAKGNCAENSTDGMSTSVSVEDIGNFVGQNQLVNRDNNQESVNVVNGKIIVDNNKHDESSKSQTGLTVDKSLTQSTVDSPPPESTVDKPPSESIVDKPQTELTVDKPPTKSTADKPPTESTVDKPSTKSTANKPSTESTVDKPPTELNVDKPRPELTVDKPPTKSTVDKPSTESTVDKPPTKSTADKPSTESTVDKPSTKSTADKPSTELTVDKPPTELNVDKPRPELTVDKPPTKSTVDKPSTESTVDKPPTKSTVDKPSTESAVDKPPTKSTVDKPSTELTVDKPRPELTVDKPSTELTIDKPSTESTVDKPSTELTVDKPVSELAVDKSATEFTVDKQQTESSVDKPPTEFTIDKPLTELNVDKPPREFAVDETPTELNIDKLSTELIVDKPQTELTVDKPRTELIVDKPQTELNIDKLQTELTVDKPQTELIVDKPQTELNIDKLQTELTVDKPQTELIVDKPQTELNIDKLQTELTVDKPQTELIVDKPQTELNIDKLQTELTVDKPQTEFTIDKPPTELNVDELRTELAVDQPPTELNVDILPTELNVDKPSTELNVDEQRTELAVDKTPTELTFNKPPTEMTIDKSTEMTIDKPTEMTIDKPTEMTIDKPTEMTIDKPTELTVNKSITKIQKTGETSKYKTPVNTKTVKKSPVKAITINKVQSVVMETTKCVKERDSSSQGSAKANVMKDWKFSNKARPLMTKLVTPGKSKVMKDDTGIKHRNKSLDSTNTMNNQSTNTLNNKSVDQSFLKTPDSTVKVSEIKTSTGHFRKLPTQESEKSDDLVTMPAHCSDTLVTMTVPCSDSEHRNDSKPTQNDDQHNETSDISELKIISVCGNVDFDQVINTEQDSVNIPISYEVDDGRPVISDEVDDGRPGISDEVDDGRPVISDELDDGRPVTPSVENLDQILNSTPMKKYNKITDDNVKNKKDGNVTKPESNTCVEVTNLPSLVNKNKHSGSLSQTFATMGTNINTMTDESDLDSSGDKLVIDMNSKSESTHSDSQSESYGVDHLRMIPTETRQDLVTMETTVNTTSRNTEIESNDTVSYQEMSSKGVTTENNQSLFKTEESKANGMETVSTSLEETMIYANSDLETSKDTVEFCERRQTTDESTISNDNKEVEDYDDFDDDIQIMWYIKGVPQSPWTSDTPHIKQEMMDDEEEDDEFKQPPVLPDLDEYFKQNPGIFSKMKGKAGDTSVNSTSSSIVPSSQPDSPQLEDSYDNLFFNNMVENPDFRYDATPIIDDNDSNQSGQSQTDNVKIGEDKTDFNEGKEILETRPQSENNEETTTKEQVSNLVFDKYSKKILELNKNVMTVNGKNELMNESITENISDEESNNTINKTESRAINRQSESKSSLSEKQSDDDMKIYVAESLPASDDDKNNSQRPYEGATNQSDKSPCTAHDDANITDMPQTDQESTTNESDMPPTVDIEITTNEQERSRSTENMYDAVKHHSRQKKSTHSTSNSQTSHIYQQQQAQIPLMGSFLFPPSVQSKNNEIKAMQQNQRFKLEDVVMFMREPAKKLLLSLKLMSIKLTNNGTYDFSNVKRIRFTHIKILNDGQTKNTIGEFIPAFLSDQLLRCVKCISCNGCFSPYRFMKHICNVQWTRVSEKSFQNHLIPTEVPNGSAIGVWKFLCYVLDMEKHLSKNKNVQNIDELPPEFTRDQIHTYTAQREAQPNNGQTAHTYTAQRETQPNNGQTAHVYTAQKEAQPNNGQTAHTYTAQRETQPNNGQTAHVYTAQKEAQPNNGQTAHTYSAQREAQPSNGQTAHTYTAQREAQPNNVQTVHTYTRLQQISMDDRSCQQQYQSYQYPQINQSLACQTGSTVHHPPSTYQQVCSNQTSQLGSHVRYPPPYIQQSINVNQRQSQHRRQDQPSQNVITNAGTSYQPTFQPTSQSSYTSGANQGNTYQPIIQTNQPCHPFVNPQMDYRYQTHLMSKPQQNLSTYNVQQTSSVASNNFIGQSHQQLTNKKQGAYKPCTQNSILKMMLIDDRKVQGTRSDNVHAVPQRYQSTYVESISKEQGTRSDNVHALPQRNQSTYVESISKEQGTRLDNVLVLPKENQSELQSTSSLTENENMHCSSRFNSNQHENISGTAQHGNKFTLDTILPNGNQKDDSSATSEKNQCLTVTLCNNTNTQSDTGLTSSETNINKNSTPVTSVTHQLSPMTTPELSCQPPAVQSISSKPGGSESRRRSFPSYQESNKQEMRQTPEKYQEIMADRENVVSCASTTGPDVPLILEANEVPSCSSSAASNVPKKNMPPHSNLAEKEVVPCLNSAGNETQNQTRPLHFQRPSDVIKAFKFAQDVQFQAISKLHDFILKDQEKQEKLQKDFEDEQERRIAAEKKLEELEKQFGSMLELLHKKS